MKDSRSRSVIKWHLLKDKKVIFGGFLGTNFFNIPFRWRFVRDYISILNARRWNHQGGWAEGGNRKRGKRECVDPWKGFEEEKVWGNVREKTEGIDVREGIK